MPWPPPYYPDWAPPPPDEEPPSSAKIPGVSSKGLPLAERGRIALEGTSGVVLADGHVVNTDTPFGGGLGRSSGDQMSVVDIVAHVPIVDRVFIDGAMPLSLGGIGNPTLGMHFVARPSQRVWIRAGGFFGFPVVTQRPSEMAGAVRAFWDGHEFWAETVPIGGVVAIEGHASIVEIRAEVSPIAGISIAKSVDSRCVVQQAFEIQLGHEIGGGLRYQGVIFATDSNPADERDHFQAALEPFLAVRRGLAAFRLGLLLPLDTPLGVPFDNSWAVRLSAGIHID
jgi:hypothetical protein